MMPSPEDINLLCLYAWPGNIRELAAVIDRAAILGDGKSLEIATSLGIRPNSEGAGPAGNGCPADRPTAASDEPVGDLSLDTAMVRHIEMVLRQTGGQIEGATGAARLLDINPHTLRARMRKLGIDWQRFRA